MVDALGVMIESIRLDVDTAFCAAAAAHTHSAMDRSRTACFILLTYSKRYRLNRGLLLSSNDRQEC